MRKTILRRILIIPALLIAALLPEQALACITVSLGWWEDGDKVKATAFIEDYYDQGDCYYSAGSTRFTHNYAASVQIQSPQGRWASDSDSMNNVRNGGGYADAFTSISTRNDFGIYNVTVSASIVCSTGMNAAYQDAGQLEVEDQCEGLTPIPPWGGADPFDTDDGLAASTRGTRDAHTCIMNGITAAGGRAHTESAYRPEPYQKHIQRVYDRLNDIEDWESGQCPAVQRNANIEAIRHEPFRSRPADNSYHTTKIAFDLSIRGLNDGVINNLAAGCNLRRSNNHFTYTGGN